MPIIVPTCDQGQRWLCGPHKCRDHTVLKSTWQTMLSQHPQIPLHGMVISILKIHVVKTITPRCLTHRECEDKDLVHCFRVRLDNQWKPLFKHNELNLSGNLLQHT
ncbi:hypothetical protein AMECASPLE_039437 [Ameca splendens]|uniref:Uncharacterized protein n=1 Tax=Ameca splendens TaxID=208324 RepID=A0ABV1AG16_9TELE